MALPTNIKTLLSGDVVEWARIEFKETWDPEASLKTICAFANDIDNWGGGYLVIGVEEENGRPKSLPGVPSEKIDRYLKDMLNKCKLIQPEYMPIVEVSDYKGKKFIVLWAPGGSVRPYSAPRTMAKNNRERVYYIRKVANTIAPSNEDVRDLFALANNIPFDDRVNHEANLTDLNITLIQNYLSEVNSSLYDAANTLDFPELCHNMNLLSSLPEYAKPKNVALMFFSLTPEKFFPYTQIDIVQFPEGTGGNKITEKTFKGPIHQQLREALQYIRNTILVEQVIKRPDCAEADRFFNYPYVAIKEALANAVYHRAYDIREPIEVRIEPDRMEILSFPGPDRSVTKEGLKNYHVTNRRYRNRRIGEFLKELHLTEGRNTGFKKIVAALERNGSPKPEFETDDERTYFISRFFPHPYFNTGEIGIPVGKSDDPGANGANFGANGGNPGANGSNPGANGGNPGANGGNPGANGGNPGANGSNPGANGGNPDRNVVGGGSDPSGNLVGNELRIYLEIAADPSASSALIAERLSLGKRTVQRISGILRDKGYISREGSTRGKWIILK